MSIKDEAVEAAHIAANQKANLHTYVSEISVRAALEAALPHLSQGAARDGVMTADGKLIRQLRRVGTTNGHDNSVVMRTADRLENLSPAPVGVTDEGRGKIAYALTKRLVIDMPAARAAVDEALASHEPAPTEMQEGMSEAGEVVAWMHPSAGWANHDRSVIHHHCRKDGSDGGPIPLVRQSALITERERWRSNSRDTFNAMVAMRNSINEHIPMPSPESDLLSGPENSVFCSKVAEAVISAITACQQEVEKADANAMAWGAELKSAEARILELETDLEVANDKLRKMVKALASVTHQLRGWQPEEVALDSDLMEDAPAIERALRVLGRAER